jgi:hypothetical protein
MESGCPVLRQPSPDWLLNICQLGVLFGFSQLELNRLNDNRVVE